jgi:diacylglycerol kinase (ATP)
LRWSVAIRAGPAGWARSGPAHYGFTTLEPIPLQLDGEVLALDAGTKVQVDIAPGALATIG